MRIERITRHCKAMDLKPGDVFTWSTEASLCMCIKRAERRDDEEIAAERAEKELGPDDFVNPWREIKHILYLSTGAVAPWFKDPLTIVRKAHGVFKELPYELLVEEEARG